MICVPKIVIYQPKQIKLIHSTRVLIVYINISTVGIYIYTHVCIFACLYICTYTITHKTYTYIYIYIHLNNKYLYKDPKEDSSHFIYEKTETLTGGGSSSFSASRSRLGEMTQKCLGCLPKRNDPTMAGWWFKKHIEKYESVGMMK